MKEVLQNTTFGSRVLFINLDGKPSESLSRFTFKYSTALSDAITVSYDGTDYHNCSPIEGGIISHFVAPRFNTGRLSVQRTIFLVDSKGLERKITEVKPLDVTIVQSYSEPQQISQSTSVLFSEDGFMISETIELDIKEGPVGATGPRGIVGPSGPIIEQDYSILSTPAIVPGVFSYNAQSAKKQVYTQTFKLKTSVTGDYTHLPLTTHNWGIIIGAFGTAYFNGASAPISMSSVIMSGGGSNPTRLWGICHKISLWGSNHTIPNNTDFVITLQYTT